MCVSLPPNDQKDGGASYISFIFLLIIRSAYVAVVSKILELLIPDNIKSEVTRLRSHPVQGGAIACHHGITLRWRP